MRLEEKRTLIAGNTPIHLASAANRLDVMEELVAKSPDSVNLRNAAGELPSDVAGCEAAKDMVKPFKRAVNAVRAALKFGALGNLSSSPLSSPGVKSASPLSSKFTRTPRSSMTMTKPA